MVPEAFLVLALLLLFITDFAIANTKVKGDYNGDGEVNARDVIALMTAIVENTTTSDMDYDGDGDINARDVIALMTWIVNN